jgi:hypothetical protein
MNELKQCATCLEMRPLDGFYRHKACAGGHLKHCKQCVLAAQKAKRAAIADRPDMRTRFESKFIVTPGCWPWQNSRDTSGYGLFLLNRKQCKAHRVSYEMYVGPIPDGLHVLHSCDNPRCVNPDHLSVGTNLENMQDRERKGRGVRQFGEKHHNSKLTTSEAKAIRADQRKQRDIAAEYGVSQHTVWQIKKNLIWREA